MFCLGVEILRRSFRRSITRSKRTRTASLRGWIRIHDKLREWTRVASGAIAKSVYGKLIADYLNLIRHSNQDIVPGLINLKYPDASIELPANFPDVAKTPRFLYGDRLRWLSTQSDTDWGIVIGRFYSNASDRCGWSWCYLI